MICMSDCKDYLYPDIVYSVRTATEEGYSNTEVLIALSELLAEEIVPMLLNKNTGGIKI